MIGTVDGLIRQLPRNYRRRTEVIDEICQFLRLSPPDQMARIRAVLEGREPWPSHECMVYLVRHLASRGREEMAWRSAEMLSRKVAPLVGWHMSRICSLSQSTREEIAADLAAALYEAWMSLEPQHAFWEVHFNFCLRNKIVDLVRAALRSNRIVADLAGDPDEEAEDALASLPDSRAVPPDQLAMAYLLLQSLPPDLQLLMHLRHYEGLTEAEIAARLNVTDRTVRNRLTKALAVLQAGGGVE